MQRTYYINVATSAKVGESSVLTLKYVSMAELLGKKHIFMDVADRCKPNVSESAIEAPGRFVVGE